VAGFEHYLDKHDIAAGEDWERDIDSGSLRVSSLARKSPRLLPAGANLAGWDYLLLGTRAFTRRTPDQDLLILAIAHATGLLQDLWVCTGGKHE
jgi:hypothetical protein